MNKKYKIYRIKCLITNKYYIGQTYKSLNQRFKKHIQASKEFDTYFYRAIRKYGKDNFKIELIDEAETQDEADEKEYKWILFYSLNAGIYNTKISKGKCGGDTLSNHQNIKEIKNKISISKLGDKNPMRKNGGLKGEKNGMYGKYSFMNPNSKKCVAINTDSEIMYFFHSIADCRRYFGLKSYSAIYNRCKNYVTDLYKGIWIFKYLDEYDLIPDDDIPKLIYKDINIEI